MFRIKGKLAGALEKTQGVSKKGNTWCSQQYVLEIGDTDKKYLVFSIFGEDRIIDENLESLIGMNVDVELSIESKKFNERWYTNVSYVRLYGRPEIDKPKNDFYGKENKTIPF